jgi:hypothetical protein
MEPVPGPSNGGDTEALTHVVFKPREAYQCRLLALLGSAACGVWIPLSDPKRKSVDCRWRLVYEFTA